MIRDAAHGTPGLKTAVSPFLWKGGYTAPPYFRGEQGGANIVAEGGATTAIKTVAICIMESFCRPKLHPLDLTPARPYAPIRNRPGTQALRE